MKTNLFLTVFIASVVLLSSCTSRTSNENKNAGGNASIDTSRYYYIISLISGKALDIEGGASDDGARLIQYTLKKGDNQKFKFKLQEDGSYNIVCKSSSKCIDVPNSTKDDGANLVQWTKNGGQNQKFNLVPQPDGSFNIVSSISGKFLDIYNNSKDDSAPLIQWPGNGGENQKFKFEVAE